MKNDLRSKFFLGFAVAVFVFIGGAFKVQAAPFTTVLKIGMSSPEVLSLQQDLNASGNFVATNGAGSMGMESTFFGPATEKAVMAFQLSKGITPDGIVGPDTAVALSGGSVLGASTTASLYVQTITLHYGMNNSQVKNLQIALNSLNFKVATTGAGSPGMEQTYFGTKTRAAVEAFQKSKGFTANGVVGTQTGQAIQALTVISTTPPPPPTTTPPTVKVGSTVTITLPATTATISGTATPVSPATIKSYAWTETSGPATASITSPTAASTALSGLTVAGTYVFKLSATDSNNLSSSATVSVTVNAVAGTTPPPAPPVTTTTGTALPCTQTVSTFDFSTVKYKAGDVVCVKAGTYTSGSLVGLSNVTIQNTGGQVVLSGAPNEAWLYPMSNLTNVTLSGSGTSGVTYGFEFTNGTGFAVSGNSVGFNMSYVQNEGGAVLLDAGHAGTTWTLANATTDAGFVFSNSKWDHIFIDSAGGLFQGNWGTLDQGTNFVTNIEVSNVIVNNTQNAMGGCGMFNMNVHDWTVTNPNNVDVNSTSGNAGDYGMISMCGDGTFQRIHRVGGWGWLIRNYHGAALGATTGTYSCNNNVDIGTEYYGVCEARNDDVSDPYLIPGQISPVTINISNNYGAHKRDAKFTNPGPTGTGYTTAVALIPDQYNGPVPITINSNTACDDTEESGAVNGVLYWDNGGGEANIVQSNNKASASCTGITDPITGLAF